MEYESFALMECGTYNFTYYDALYDTTRRRRLASTDATMPTVGSAFACVVNDDIYPSEDEMLKAYPSAAHPMTSLWKNGSAGLEASCEAVQAGFSTMVGLPASAEDALGISCPDGYSR